MGRKESSDLPSQFSASLGCVVALPVTELFLVYVQSGVYPGTCIYLRSKKLLKERSYQSLLCLECVLPPCCHFPCNFHSSKNLNFSSPLLQPLLQSCVLYCHLGCGPFGAPCTMVLLCQLAGARSVLSQFPLLPVL